jgi:hypothetical protein
MAAMSTALAVFSDNGNTRTYTYTGHTALDPKLVIQRRRVPVGSQVIQEDAFRVIEVTPDADGAILPERVSFEAIVRRPVNRAADTDVTSALAVFRDIVASDEFGVMVTGQKWLKQ